MKRKQLVTYDTAIVTPRQHQAPCLDCPWSRLSLPGWLGPGTVEEWLQSAHGEEKIECHAQLPHQCAGVAIYRANVGKVPRDRSLLVLEKNLVTVFASPAEFQEHHEL